MILLDVPKSVERDLAVNAVRSPLDPSKRAAKDRQGYKQEYQRALVADVDKKAADSVRQDPGRQGPRTTFEAQRGLLLHSETIISRLRRLNASLVFQKAVARPELIGVYVKSERPEHQPEGLAFTGVSFNDGPNPEFAVIKKEDDYVSQDGQIHIGECKGIAYIGWRTALSRLIRKRFISESQADVLFGTCGTSAFWAAQLGHRSSIE